MCWVQMRTMDTFGELWICCHDVIKVLLRNLISFHVRLSNECASLRLLVNHGIFTQNAAVLSIKCIVIAHNHRMVHYTLNCTLLGRGSFRQVYRNSLKKHKVLERQSR